MLHHFKMSMTAAALESHLSLNSYISGYAFSQADVDEFNALAGKPLAPHTARWARHIAFLIGEPYVREEPVEIRGVKLIVFQAVRDYALTLNPDKNYWSIERVLALIVGNHEILKTGCRFGADTDPETTLTFISKDWGGPCSLIDMLQRKYFDSSHRHPVLNTSYEEAVGVDANVFLSFAYSDNFFELVNSLEQSSDTFNKDTTYYSFDMFVNNQWLADEKSSHWWLNTFRNTIKKIGRTLCFLSSWKNPTLVSRAWCLYEISCSDTVSIALSASQKEDFQRVLRSDYKTIVASLCEIDLEKAVCLNKKDKEKIFAAVRSTKEDFAGFNNKVVGLLRDWVASSTRALVADFNARRCIGSSDIIRGTSSSRGSGDVDKEGKNEYDEDEESNLTMDQLSDLNTAAIVLEEAGHLTEARPLKERALRGREKALGPEHPRTLTSVNNLAVLLKDQGHLAEARPLLRQP